MGPGADLVTSSSRVAFVIFIGLHAEPVGMLSVLSLYIFRDDGAATRDDGAGTRDDGAGTRGFYLMYTDIDV